MFCRGSRAFLLIVLSLFSGAALAEDKTKVEIPQTASCPAVPAQTLGPDEERDWGLCERWAWSCIRRGLEVNFYVKDCFEQRSDASKVARKRFKYAPYFEPERYKSSNALGARFLYTILTRKELVAELPTVGIRLVGAYFEETVNLENVTTDRNLVLDQSIFRKGLRFTNFKTERNLSLDGSNVRGRIYLLRAQVGGTLFMEEGVYDLVDAGDARFGGSIDAPSSVFNAPFRLDRVKVEGKVSFIRARLTELTAFDTTIGSKLELRFANVRGRIDLTGSTIGGDLRMQRLKFGREVEGHPVLTCDWVLDDTKRFFLHPEFADFSGQPGLYDGIVKEAVSSRPSEGRPEYPCLKAAAELSRNAQHEVLLRDLKIGGALCLIDISGEIEKAPNTTSLTRQNVATVSLDGSEARSTILRWSPSWSDTLWQAVHFKTKNLFIDLGHQPKQHFIDNLEIGNISFLKPIPVDREAQEQEEESRNFLCDVPSGPDARYASDEIDTHQRIIDFFNSEGNRSKSAQPFGEIVARLNESNSSSMMLKMALSEYKLSKVCTSSDYFKHHPLEPTAAALASAQSQDWKVADLLTAAGREKARQSLDESRNIALDAACLGGLKAYKYSVAYGHQPHNILVLIAVFVLLFRGLLYFDTPGPEPAPEVRPPQLGILYAIDMFTPFIKLNQQHSEWKPNRRSLRAYLIFHRVVGLVLTSFLAIGIYAARW